MASPSEILDFPIVFVEPTSFQVPALKNSLDYSLEGIGFLPPFSPVKEKWIYAFSVTPKDGHTVNFVAEFGASKEGTFRRNKCENRLKVDPANATEFTGAAKAAKLDTKVNGSSLYYFFMVSRVRLAAKALRELARFKWAGYDNFKRAFVEKRNGFRIPVWDLTTKDHFVGDSDGSWLPVLDYLSLGESLSADYFKALDRYDAASDPNYYTPGTPEREAFENKLLRYALASAIRRLSKDDEEDSKKKIGKMERLIVDSRDFEREVGQLRLQVERFAERVCGWFRSTAFGMADTWYQHHGEKGEADFVMAVGAIHHRLDESIAGVHSLKDPGPYLSDLLERLVFPGQKALYDDKKTYGVIKKSAAGIASLWSKFLPWYLPIHANWTGTKSVDKAMRLCVDHLNRGFEEPLFDIFIRSDHQVTLNRKAFFRVGADPDLGALNLGQRRAFRLTGRPPNQIKKNEAQRLIEAVREVEALQDMRVGVKTEAAKKAAKSKDYWGAKTTAWIYRAVDSVNNGWKIYALVNCERATVYDYIECVGGISGLMKSWVIELWEDGLIAANKTRQAAGLEKLAVPRLLSSAKTCAGVIGLVADVASAWKDFRSAMDDADKDAQVAIAVAGTAAVVGGILTLTTLPWAAPVIFFCAVVQGTGSLMTYLLRDTRVALFVEHSIYGTNWRQSKGAPKWSRTKFCDWNDDRQGLINQIEALQGLLIKFKIRTVRQGVVSIDIASPFPGSLLTVVYADCLLGETKVQRHAAMIDLDDPIALDPAGGLSPLLVVRTTTSSGAARSLTISYRDPASAREVGAAFLRVYLTMKLEVGRGQPVEVVIPGREYELPQPPSPFELPVVSQVKVGIDGKSAETKGVWHPIVQAGQGSGRGQIYNSLSATPSVPE